MPWGGLGPLLFPFWVSVTWSLNACFTHPKPHKNQLDSNSGRKGRAGNTDFLILSFWGSSFTLPSTIARQANWFVTSRDTRRSWQLTWNIIERGLCCGIRWGQGRTTSWGCHWCRWVWCGSHGDGTAAGGTVMGWPKLMVFKAVGFFFSHPVMCWQKWNFSFLLVCVGVWVAEQQVAPSQHLRRARTRTGGWQWHLNIDE